MNQDILLVNGIMLEHLLLLVCLIMQHLLLAKLTGSFNNQTGVGNATIIGQSKGMQYQLVIFGRFSSDKIDYVD
jgi:hypothetical protein